MNYLVIFQKQEFLGEEVEHAFVLTLDFGTRVQVDDRDVTVEHLHSSTLDWLPKLKLSNARLVSRHSSKKEADDAVQSLLQMLQLHSV